MGYDAAGRRQRRRPTDRAELGGYFPPLQREGLTAQIPAGISAGARKAPPTSGGRIAWAGRINPATALVEGVRA